MSETKYVDTGRNVPVLRRLRPNVQSYLSHNMRLPDHYVSFPGRAAIVLINNSEMSESYKASGNQTRIDLIKRILLPPPPTAFSMFTREITRIDFVETGSLVVDLVVTVDDEDTPFADERQTYVNRMSNAAETTLAFAEFTPKI